MTHLDKAELLRLRRGQLKYKLNKQKKNYILLQESMKLNKGNKISLRPPGFIFLINMKKGYTFFSK